MKIRFLIIFILISSELCYSQNDSLRYSDDDLIQSVLDESQSGEEDEGLLDLIEEMRSNPVNLNEAGIADLQKIPGLNFSDAAAIVNYRNSNGNFFSVNELILTGIPEQVFENIRQFVSVNLNGEMRGGGKKFINQLNIRSRVLDDLQKEKGFTDNKFAGNNLHTYTRFTAQFGKTINAGILTDKDPGEKSYNDLTSGFISVNRTGLIRKIILGDYSVQFGQGLAIWSPYSLSKSSNAIYPVKKNPDYIKEYKSTDENRFMRGISSTIGIRRFSITSFYSLNKFDAGLDPANNEIISAPLDGLHRTAGEIAKRNTSSEKMLGLIMDYKSPGSFEMGFLYYRSSFANSFEPKNIYDISGDRFNFYSLSYDIYFDKINLSGESSFNGKSLASIVNLQFAFNEDISFITSIRNYPRNYFNLHSSGFGEGTNTQNEFGIYNGIRWRTIHGTFNFYFDQFRFPFSTYYNPLPSSGKELSFDFLSAKFKNLRLHVKVKREEKETGFDAGGEILLLDRIKSTARFELIYHVNKALRLKSRAELSYYSIKEIGRNENGFLIFQDARFRAAGNIDFAGRIIFFRTDSFNSVIYEFENDLDGMFSLFGLYGEGIRWYAMAEVKLPGSLLLSFKYSETYKPGEKTMGSGYSTITGNLDNRISVQLELKI